MKELEKGTMKVQAVAEERKAREDKLRMAGVIMKAVVSGSFLVKTQVKAIPVVLG